MARIEIRRIDVWSAFRTVFLSFGIVSILMMVAGIFIGALQGEPVLTPLIGILLFPLRFGVAVIIMVLSFNWLAPKFGGLVVEVND